MPSSQLTPQQLARTFVAVAEDKKAWEPVTIDVRGQTTVADYFVICEGDTDRQVRSIADAMIEKANELGLRPLAVEGYEDASWVLLDFDAVLVHIFLPGERSYYDLESLWTAAAKRRSNAGSGPAG